MSFENNEAFERILNEYRMSCIARGLLESTANGAVEMIGRIIPDIMNVSGATFEDGKFVRLNARAMRLWQMSLVEKNLSVGTRNLYTIHINQFLRWAMDMEYIPYPQNGETPVHSVLHCARKPKEDSIPEEEQKQKWFTQDEIRNLIINMPGREYMRNRDRAMIAVMAGSGIRISALCGLKIGDVYEQPHGIIRIKNKGGSWKRAHLADWVYPILDAYMKTRDDRAEMGNPLFLTKMGTPFNRRSAYELIAGKEKALGMQTGCHIFRHSFVSETTKTGGLGVARDLVMHKSANITNIYSHASEEDLVNAVNSMGLSDLVL